MSASMGMFAELSVFVVFLFWYYFLRDPQLREEERKRKMLHGSQHTESQGDSSNATRPP